MTEQVYTTQHVEDAVGAIRQRTTLVPRIALVLGSGLGSMAGRVTDAVSLPYRDIPHFPISTAPGHAGRLVLGTLEGHPVVVMAGRVHMYEGYSAHDVVFPLRVMHALGAQVLIITNAAGGVNTDFIPGTLMVITDHINLTGRNPLVGPNDSAVGPRFPDMTEAYAPDLRELARETANDLALPVAEGVYLGLLGPNYETPAEIRMARTLGVDAVGMSTVMEVIAANHMGMSVLGISCITNMAAGVLPRKLTEEEVLETAAAVQAEFSALLMRIVQRMSKGKRTDEHTWVQGR
jgi:purine-nucleoside phosphorylase